MLTSLRLRDFAIAADLQLDLSGGFTVITGETGAGKSILIDGLRLLLGGRASDKVVRAGAERAVLEATFDARAQPSVLNTLRERGVEVEDGELVVRRIIPRSGNRRAWINGMMMTATDLRAVLGPLVDLSTQHQQNRLLDRRSHLSLLDAMAQLDDERASYETQWRAWRDMASRQQELRAQLQAHDERRDYLQFCVAELAEAEVQPGEVTSLDQRARRLRSAESLVQTAMAAWGALADEGGARDAMASQQRALGRAAEQDEELTALSERYQGLMAEVEELSNDLQRYAERVELSPEALHETEERLSRVIELIRKYGGDEDSLFERWRGFERELEAQHLDVAELERVEQELPELAERVRQSASRLSAARAHAAQDVRGRVETVIHALAMDKATFEILLEPLDEPGADGVDKVTFMLASNPGEPAQPLSKVASGGELSRVLLGLKRACADVDPVGTCVYDEVDAGLSGRTGVVLGRFLRDLGTKQQVLCISHLPQVAAAADHHVMVRKSTHLDDAGERTTSNAAVLGQAEQRQELARMLAGDSADADGLRLADELVNRQRRATIH